MLTKPDVLDPEDNYQEPDQKAVALGITVTSQVSDRRSIVMQTYVARDVPLSLYHLTLDKISAAVDRQEAKARLEGLQAELGQHEKTLRALEEDYAGIEGRNAETWKARGKKGEPQLSDNERAQKATAKTNIERYRVEIKKIIAEISKCEALVAKGD